MASMSHSVFDSLNHAHRDSESSQSSLPLPSKAFGDMSPFKPEALRCESIGSELSRSSYGAADERLLLDSSIGPLSDLDQSPSQGNFHIISPEKGKSLSESLLRTKPTPVIHSTLILPSISDQDTAKNNSGIPVAESSAFSKPIKSVNRALQFSENVFQTPQPALGGRTYECCCLIILLRRSFRNLCNIEVGGNACPSSPSSLHGIIEVDESSGLPPKYSACSPSPFIMRSESDGLTRPTSGYSKFHGGVSLLSPSPSLSQVYISSPHPPPTVRAGSPIRTEV